MLIDPVDECWRDGLKDTPLRAAKALHFLTQGYRMDIDEVINGALFESDNEVIMILTFELNVALKSN